MRVVGTAGHVDHGKSTLIRALTGIDPDRLAEEKAREMTIDLGFAWMDVPSGETIGFVDVPGHRDFIENMLAGVGGIDAVLLIIAADEGVMPQTREHLAILDLLGIQHGLIVLTKIDMVDDSDWLALIEQDVRQAVAGTTLAEAEIVRVSARAGIGLAELTARLTALLNNMPPRADYRHPRLPVDRIFSISGFGTVVTGTLLGGRLRVGQEVEIQPGSIRARIRGLQSYKQSVEVAEPGSRVAINLAGTERAAILRGHVVAPPGQMQVSSLVDVRFRHLADVGRPLKHDAEVKVFVGTAESLAHARLLGDEILPPGAEGWLQLRLQTPLALAQGDRFILRYPSPPQTIGGGVVVDPHPDRRWRRFQSDVIEKLETRMRGTPAEQVAQAASQSEPVKAAFLLKQLGYTPVELEAALQSALDEKRLLELPGPTYIAAAVYDGLVEQIIQELSGYHRANPLRIGMSREELRARLGLKQAFFNLLLDLEQSRIISQGDQVRLIDHVVHFSPDQTARIQQLMAQMHAAPYTPPSFTDAAQIVGEDVLFALIDLGEIIRVQPEVIFLATVYNEMVSVALEIIDQTGSVAANQLRDRFNTTRKYAIGLLEFLDAVGITRRNGDVRVRGPRRL
jgi:selenocysteine-specific elongation factor